VAIGIEHVKDYTLIWFKIWIQIIAADSIRDSIWTKIPDSQVPTTKLNYDLKTKTHKSSIGRAQNSINLKLNYDRYKHSDPEELTSDGLVSVESRQPELKQHWQWPR